MPARVTFTDAGVAFDADGALAPAAQLVAKLRLAIDAGWTLRHEASFPHPYDNSVTSSSAVGRSAGANARQRVSGVRRRSGNMSK